MRSALLFQWHICELVYDLKIFSCATQKMEWQSIWLQKYREQKKKEKEMLNCQS